MFDSHTPDSLQFFIDTTLKILVATVCGGFLGIERELGHRPAGLKTIIFIIVGSTMFAHLSFYISQTFGGDPMRIAANIATGIGFLGAGAIIQRREEGIVRGLTTAAIIWFAGSLGILIGGGYYMTAVAVAGGGFLFLKFLEYFEEKILKTRCIPRKIELEIDNTQENFQSILESARTCPKIQGETKISRNNESLKAEFYICGIHSSQDKLDKILSKANLFAIREL